MTQRIVVLVSSDSSDIFFANQIIKYRDVVGVVVEQQWERAQKRNRFLKALRIMAQPKILMNRISQKISKLKTEQYSIRNIQINSEYFGEKGESLIPKTGCKIIYTEGCKAINNPLYSNEIAKFKPDVIAVCGASLLKKEILSVPPKGVLNLHGGLAQAYRGVWTTHWALINKEPEYIGATVHYVGKGIDDGHVIYQGRPHIESNDNPGTLYGKVIHLGIDMMIQALQDIENNSVKCFPLLKKGKLYLEKMMTHQQFCRAWENTDNGVIHLYLKDKERRDAKVEQTIMGRYPKIDTKQIV